MALSFLALAAIASAQPTPSPVRAAGSVSVQILSGVQVQLGPQSTDPMVKTKVQTEDGQLRPAYLIEFE